MHSSRRCTLNPKILYTSPQTHYCWAHLYVPAIYHDIEQVLIQSTITSLYSCSNLGTELACMWFVHLQYVYTHDARQNATSIENTASSVGYRRRCYNYECQIHNAPETQTMYIHLPSPTVVQTCMNIIHSCTKSCTPLPWQQTTSSVVMNPMQGERAVSQLDVVVVKWNKQLHE